MRTLDRLAHYLPSSLRDESEREIFLALAGSVSLALLSIAASEILLGGALLGTLWLWTRKGRTPAPPASLQWPLLSFFIWTLVAALASSNVLLGLTILKKFFIFSVIFLIADIGRGRGKIAWVYNAVFVTAAISSCAGQVQFIAQPRRDLLHRISGFMSQWMTYSGLLMLVLVAAVAYTVCFGWKKHPWHIVLSLLLVASLYLSQTRNAWLGAVAGLVVVFLLSRPRAIAGLLLSLLLLYLLSPDSIRERLRTGLDRNDPNTRNRIELFETSLRLIRDKPWFGVGPKNVSRDALRYRGTKDYPDWMYQHMHNNFLQLAAERGIPGLIFWLWFMGRLAWDSGRVFRFSSSKPASLDEKSAEARMAATAALGAWVALLVSGMFEYNFGDSEVLILFLAIMSAPYAFPRQRSEGLDGAS